MHVVNLLVDTSNYGNDGVVFMKINYERMNGFIL